MTEIRQEDEYLDDENQYCKYLVYGSSIIIFSIICFISLCLFCSCTINMQNVISENSSAVADDTDSTDIKPEATLEAKPSMFGF